MPGHRRNLPYDRTFPCAHRTLLRYADRSRSRCRGHPSDPLQRTRPYMPSPYPRRWQSHGWPEACNESFRTPEEMPDNCVNGSMPAFPVYMGNGMKTCVELPGVIASRRLGLSRTDDVGQGATSLREAVPCC